MISIRSLAILLIVSIAMANCFKTPQLKNSKRAKMSKRELANTNLENLQLESPANLKSNAAKDEANVKLEQGNALEATNLDTNDFHSSDGSCCPVFCSRLPRICPCPDGSCSDCSCDGGSK